MSRQTNPMTDQEAYDTEWEALEALLNKDLDDNEASWADEVDPWLLDPSFDE